MRKPNKTVKEYLEKRKIKTVPSEKSTRSTTLRKLVEVGRKAEEALKNATRLDKASTVGRKGTENPKAYSSDYQRQHQRDNMPGTKQAQEKRIQEKKKKTNPRNQGWT